MKRFSVLLMGIALMSTASFGVLESFEYTDWADAQANGWGKLGGNAGTIDIVTSGVSNPDGAAINPTDGSSMATWQDTSNTVPVATYSRDFFTTAQREWEVSFDLFVEQSLTASSTGNNVRVSVGNADFSRFFDVSVATEGENRVLVARGTIDSTGGVGVANMAPNPVLADGWNHIVMVSEIQTVDYNAGAPESAWDAKGGAEYWETLRLYVNGVLGFESHSDFYGWTADQMTSVRIGHRTKGTANGAGYLDNLSVVPEPATLALLGLGALAMRKRRRL